MDGDGLAFGHPLPPAGLHVVPGQRVEVRAPQFQARAQRQWLQPEILRQLHQRWETPALVIHRCPGAGAAALVLHQADRLLRRPPLAQAVGNDGDGNAEMLGGGGDGVEHLPVHVDLDRHALRHRLSPVGVGVR